MQLPAISTPAKDEQNPKQIALAYYRGECGKRDAHTDAFASSLMTTWGTDRATANTILEELVDIGTTNEMVYRLIESLCASNTAVSNKDDSEALRKSRQRLLEARLIIPP